jgi:hypothetical protein
VTETTCFRWRVEFGGMKTDQVKRMKAFERESAGMRQAPSDLTLDSLTRRRLRGDPSEPRPSPGLYRQGASRVEGVAAKDAEEPCRRGVQHRISPHLPRPKNEHQYRMPLGPAKSPTAAPGSIRKPIS